MASGRVGAGPLTVLLLLLLTTMMAGVDGSCAAAERCCDGKDNGCRGVVVYSNSLHVGNLLYGNLSKKSCFCDSACVQLGDCCPDYRSHCAREFAFRYRFYCTLPYRSSVSQSINDNQSIMSIKSYFDIRTAVQIDQPRIDNYFSHCFNKRT